MPDPVRVLVVDDDPVIRQLISMNLTLEGFEVHTAADGQDALEVAARVRPHVATVDVMMPVLDGVATAAALRADPATAATKVCLVSARAQSAERRRLEASPGVDAFITKPFDPEDLIAVVRELAAG